MCLPFVSIVGILSGIIGILILAIPPLWPQASRQARTERTLGEKRIAQFTKENYPKLKQEYLDYVAAGYPNTREQDRSLMSEEFFIRLGVIAALFNNPPRPSPVSRLTDKKLVILGTLLSILGLLLATSSPTC